MVLGLWKIAAETPDKPTLVDPDHNTFTAGELAAASNRLVHLVRDLGAELGDTLAVLVPNGDTYVSALLAIQQAGWYLVPINYHLAGAEAAYILEDSGAKAFIAHARFAEMAIDAVARLDIEPERIFSVGGSIEGFRSLGDVLAAYPDTAPDDRTAGELMTYTSGTTGRPKGVKRPLTGLDPDTRAELGTFLNNLFGMDAPDNVHLVVAPTYHTAVTNFMQAALHAGHRIVLMDRWTPEGTLERIERYGVSTSHMVPTMFHRLLALPKEERERHDLSSLRHMIHSAAPCPVPTKHQMLEWWGPVIYEYYAATEGGGTLATPEDWLKKPGTVGNAWPISDVKIIDDEGTELPPGGIGTVWMKMGEHKFEYHGDADKTRKAWNELGYFTVGDIGEMDADGYLFLRDRKTDMIISGGVNIYPAEIENVLIQHPAVLDCAVFGIPDVDFGEQVKAAVQLTDRTAVTEEELLEYLRGELGGYKVPRSIDVHDDFPRDPNGKLYKRKLRDPYWEGRDSQLV